MDLGRHFNGLELTIAGNEFDLCDFSEVVIFSGNPKYRDSFRIALTQTTGKFHRRERFVDRVKRPSEKTGLLTGDYCDTV